MPVCVLKRLLIGLLLAAAGLNAADEPAGDVQEQRVNQPTQSESDQAQSDSGTESESATEESFTPSEKISEDLSVSFPVDI